MISILYSKADKPNNSIKAKTVATSGEKGVVLPRIVHMGVF
jgi:hypothetical protein